MIYVEKNKDGEIAIWDGTKQELIDKAVEGVELIYDGDKQEMLKSDILYKWALKNKQDEDGTVMDFETIGEAMNFYEMGDEDQKLQLEACKAWLEAHPDSQS